MTVEEAEHQIATRLYQNTAKVHFDQHAAAQGRFGRRLIYGGHVISLARALAFNGLANAFHVAAINGGRHVAPLFAGDTVYAWSEILEVAELPGRGDVGALRIRTIATKNQPCAGFPGRVDYTALGEAVNQAERLEQRGRGLAADGEETVVVASGATLEAAGEEVAEVADALEPVPGLPLAFRLRLGGPAAAAA